MVKKQEEYSVTVERLDEKGFGEAIVWRENELGNKRKIRLVIPESLPGDKVRVNVSKPLRRWDRHSPDEVIHKLKEYIEHRVTYIDILFSSTGHIVTLHL